MGVPDPAADERAEEHLPRLADAGDAARDPADYAVGEGPPDETLDLTGDVVSGPDRRLPGEAVIVSRDTDLSAAPSRFFWYDPDRDSLTGEPPDGARVDSDGNLVAESA